MRIVRHSTSSALIIYRTLLITASPGTGNALKRAGSALSIKDILFIPQVPENISNVACVLSPLTDLTVTSAIYVPAGIPICFWIPENPE